MKIWIVGLPNVWKSTLFNALTKSYSADAQNFPFCTIDPNIGVVEVRDERVARLWELSWTDKIIYANIEFVDIAGLVRWAGKWEWLGNKFLSHIREVDAIVQVLRHFQDSDVSHVEWNVDPLRDIEIINAELIFADYEQLDRKLAPLQKKAKVTNDKNLQKEVDILQKIYQALDSGKMAHKVDLTSEEKKLLKPYNLLTIKPMVYALNISQEELHNSPKIKEEFQNKTGEPVVIVCAKIESELMELDSSERKDFLKELLELENIDHVPTLDDLISLAYSTVGLSYYFTTWKKETRAWTIPIWSTAPQAAWVIHSDFERWFIKAEVVSCSDLLTCGSRNSAKEKGLVRLEWKNYLVQDWDVMIFKFNV